MTPPPPSSLIEFKKIRKRPQKCFEIYVSRTVDVAHRPWALESVLGIFLTNDLFSHAYTS